MFWKINFTPNFNAAFGAALIGSSILAVGGVVVLFLLFIVVTGRVANGITASKQDFYKRSIAALRMPVITFLLAVFLSIAENVFFDGGDWAVAASAVTLFFWLAFAHFVAVFLPNFLWHYFKTIIKDDAFLARTMRRLRRTVRTISFIGLSLIFVLRQGAVDLVFLTDAIWRIPAYIFCIVASVIISHSITRVLDSVYLYLKRIKRKNSPPAIIALGLSWPIRLVFLGVLLMGVHLFFPSMPAYVSLAFVKASVTIWVLAATMFLYRMVDILYIACLRYTKREDSALDAGAAQIVAVVARILIVLVAAIIVVQYVTGKKITGLMAGLGIGGVAVALASQDLLKNLFGGVAVMVEKPFIVGERVKALGYDGLVERIGFRSTRLRTLTGNLVTLPNETISSGAVENVGSRPYIRRTMNIGITYNTPVERVERALTRIREILESEQSHFHPDFPARVHFEDFRDWSLNLLVDYWFIPGGEWTEYLDFSQGVNFKIMRAFQEEGVSFAFPSNTTYLAGDRQNPLCVESWRGKHE